MNPSIDLFDVKSYVDRGCYVIVDSTLAPPPLQSCLALGADLVVHSATKALAGHSDAVLGLFLAKAGP
eukprot:CAMPEP_0197427032 /NCGR_PEP_ID=MMETSP1170-20131217/37047_1 /TAXON_ID=54406 /ORGANISM="Sarcinochrysis sp, Strain CCMP770" /LENGTH=67 /DNA_ID=CAMNT_0042954711 /DNA_START=1 /DNA_END=200 /DNA_ORIENTATION=-